MAIGWCGFSFNTVHHADRASCGLPARSNRNLGTLALPALTYVPTVYFKVHFLYPWVGEITLSLVCRTAPRLPLEAARLYGFLLPREMT